MNPASVVSFGLLFSVLAKASLGYLAGDGPVVDQSVDNSPYLLNTIGRLMS